MLDKYRNGRQKDQSLGTASRSSIKPEWSRKRRRRIWRGPRLCVVCFVDSADTSSFPSCFRGAEFRHVQGHSQASNSKRSQWYGHEMAPPAGTGHAVWIKHPAAPSNGFRDSSTYLAQLSQETSVCAPDGPNRDSA